MCIHPLQVPTNAYEDGQPLLPLLTTDLPITAIKLSVKTCMGDLAEK